ncbi:lysophospholipid acyltransferase family protein [Pseudazoarcus pumilus]|uniref:Lipid A biosynthesis acyltransferase n=1 Tax=Pseudazoarcus pumilus TaxID=2067960 RepID=A0A2I6S3M9_9RHOO|nr:lipid A biosynthesis acyltransferase [Pseudazoarcus pumilus]AUN93873.1 lipid A biosynthesis acyltransferase [Pseudazoarcus pumilus]
MSRIVIAIMWLLHWLPLPVLAAVGRGFGRLLYVFVRRRRHIVAVNLRLCFPELDDAARRRLARAHFAALGRSLLERGLVWWASEERLRRLIRVDNEDVIRRLKDAGRPIILLAPHFVGLDAGGAGIAMRFDSLSMYARQSDAVIDHWLLHGRERFGDQMLLARDDGPRKTVRAMKSGRPFYYLPDMNFRTKDVVFVPFFGVPTATITGLARLARLAGAAVVPCPTRMLPGGQGYVVEVGEPWENFPTDDVEADIARMNREIEAVVRTMPEQYYWVHRRFKTRPAGEKKPY